MSGFISVKELASMLLMTPRHLSRLANAKRFPGQMRTKGGQLRFRDCPALRWEVKKRGLAKSASLARSALKRRISKPKRQPSSILRNETRVNPSHHQIMNLFFQWRIHFGEQVNRGLIGLEETEQLIRDFAPIIEFVEEAREVYQDARFMR